MKKLALTIATIAALAAGAPALATDYPNKPIRMIVPFPAGGPVDVVGRVVSKKLGEVLGQNVIVDNRAGGAGAVGTILVKTAPSDGYTLLMGSTATISILPAIDTNVSYDPAKDFRPLAVAATGVHVAIISPKFPASNLTEFRAAAQAQGGAITVATGNNSSPPDLGTLMFERETGIKLQRIPYKGTSPGLADVAAGHVNLILADTSAVASLLNGGAVKAIGIASLERSPMLPNVPTLHEQGLKGFESSGWFGVFAPAGVPKDISDRLVTALAKTLADPETKSSLSKLGLLPLEVVGHAAVERVNNENTKWGSLAKQAAMASPN